MILAAVERSEDTEPVQRAEEIAQAFGDQLHVVSVTTPAKTDDIGASTEDEDHERRLKRAAERRAQDAGAGLTIKFKAVGLLGEDIAREVLRYGREINAKYIVIGSRHRSPVGKAIFGSVTQSILLNADRPVVTVMQDT